MKRRQTTVSKKNKNARVSCNVCSTAMRLDTLGRHLKTHNLSFPCQHCKKMIRSDKLLRHEILCRDKIDDRNCHRSGVECLPDPLATSVSGYFSSYLLDVPEKHDYDEILNDTCNMAKELLKEFLKRGPVKAQLLIELTFYKTGVERTTRSEKCFRSVCEPLLLGSDLVRFMARTKSYIKDKIEEYERYGSGWIFDRSNCAHLEIAKYCPLYASGDVTIPQKVKKMKSVLSIESNDGKCFLYSVLAKLHPLTGWKAKRYIKYLDYVDEIDMCGVQFPIKLDDITKIEQANNLSISVFEWNVEDECVDPLKHGCGVGTPIELLYVEDGQKAQYMLIKSFNSFMRYRSKYQHSMNFCLKCMHGFTTKELLAEHATRCSQGVFQNVKMPSKGSTIKFKAHSKQERKMFVMYSDFEATLRKLHIKNTGKTTFEEAHDPCSYCIVTKSEYEDYNEEIIVFSDPDPLIVTKQYVDDLFRIHAKMMKHYESKQHPIDMSEADEKKFKMSMHCHVCQHKLQWGHKTNYPVRDHDHTKVNQNFRGAACNSCNRNYYERSRKVAVLTHNSKNYDMSFFKTLFKGKNFAVE